VRTVGSVVVVVSGLFLRVSWRHQRYRLPGDGAVLSSESVLVRGQFCTLLAYLDFPWRRGQIGLRRGIAADVCRALRRFSAGAVSRTNPRDTDTKMMKYRPRVPRIGKGFTHQPALNALH
jgi:hypothetical protein